MESVETALNTKLGQFRIVCYDAGNGMPPDFALVRGDVRGRASVRVRLQSECVTGHIFQSLSCDCYEQLQDCLSIISSDGVGVLIYLRQEGRGIGLADKIRSYVLQKQGEDTVDANLLLGHEIDERTYGSAVRILGDLGVQSVVLLTNNPNKVESLSCNGIDVAGIEPVPPVFREENRRYLTTKVERMGHLFEIPD